MEPKQNQDERPEDYEEKHEANKGGSILDKEQPSFVDENSPRGKQFGDGRKVADLGRVGAATPDSDADEPPQQPRDERPTPRK